MANKQSIILQLKRERRSLRRRRKKKFHQSSAHLKILNFWAKADWRILEASSFALFNFFKSCGFIDGSEKLNRTIVIPKYFSLTDHFDKSIQVLKAFCSSTYLLNHEVVTIDFSQCISCDQSAVFTLQILRLDFQEYFDKLDSRLRVIKRKLKFSVIESKIESVNKLLLLGGLIGKANISDKEKMHPATTLGYFRGMRNQKNYLENKKGIITTSIVRYLNECLSTHGFEFNPEGVNVFDGLMSEILNNAEDHSPFNTYYATANFQREKLPSGNGTVGEVNISIMNFGFSIYEGFENTKEQNADVYQSMIEAYENMAKSSPFFGFTIENIFTLFALQDGISRLKFEDESRGTGTMKFINSFFSFGDYEDPEREYFPNLTVFSGKTELICDNKFKPSEKSNMFLLSLNSENDLKKPPEKSHLRSLKVPFPGTLISVKIFLNSEHINRKMDNGKVN